MPILNARSSSRSFRTRTRLLFCNYQYGVSIATSVFEVDMLQLKLKDLITIPTSFQAIMLSITVEIGTVKMYVIIYITG